MFLIGINFGIMFLILFIISYGNVHFVSSGAMYLVEPVGCRIVPKGPSNIYIFIYIYILIFEIYKYVFMFFLPFRISFYLFPFLSPLFKEQKHSGTLTINIERVALGDVVAASFGRLVALMLLQTR